MRNVLSRASRAVLRQFAWSKVLLAFDYDGTLAPIVSTIQHAWMRNTTHRLLQQVARLYPCIVISGRAQHDVVERLQGVGVRQVVGNHGLEPWHVDRQLVAKVARWRPILDERLAELQGVEIEDKKLSVAIHYRRSRAKKRARAAILKAAGALGGVRIIRGKQVVNILPKNAPHKGIALERERSRLACDTAVYVGDDETDEDVFTLDQPGQLLCIRVGRRRSSTAPYYVESQRDIDELLRVFLRLRREASPSWPMRKETA